MLVFTLKMSIDYMLFSFIFMKIFICPFMCGH